MALAGWCRGKLTHTWDEVFQYLATWGCRVLTSLWTWLMVKWVKLLSTRVQTLPWSTDLMQTPSWPKTRTASETTP